MSTAMTLGPDVGWTSTDDGRVYVAFLPRGPVLVLEDTAAVVWHAALEVPREDITAQVASWVGLPVADVEADVESFVTDLVGRGLLSS
ncbi:PqqD family protein [Janibacter indicus]|uniref:PqqD family protein n=1 Tax=Janibacter indicus TaxID=857417 RepID=UPI003EBCC244